MKMQYVMIKKIGEYSLLIENNENYRGWSFMIWDKDGLSQTPYVYSNCTVGYNYPERLPSYIKKSFNKTMLKITMLNEQMYILNK